MKERLAALDARIERVSLGQLEDNRLRRLVRPIVRVLSRPQPLDVRALRALVELATRPEIALLRDPTAAIEAAVDELEKNLRSVEWVLRHEERVDVAKSAWLRRAHGIVARISEALRSDDPVLRRMAARIDGTRILVPLARSEGDAPEPLVDLQLAGVDRLLELARGERAFLARRRSLLEAARQVLLETAAALPLDRNAVEVRRAAIAREIVRIDRLEAAGVRPDLALLHQARAALARGEPQTLHATLVALDDGAADAFDEDVARRTQRALAIVRGGVDIDEARALGASADRSAREVLGDRVISAVQEAHRRARRDLKRDLKRVPPSYVSAATKYFDPGAERQLFDLAVAVDGAFEVGGTLSPRRVVEIETRARRVPWPTQDLMLLPAKGLEDLPRAVISDPRSILLDLATGRLLTRQYVDHERIERVRTRIQSELRVYLLDGSTSMVGARARTRDAILTAELATLLERFDQFGARARVSLLYRYFDSALGPVTRVADAKGVLRAIEDVAATLRVGGTDIEGALVASLQQIAEAQASDPDLSRAQIVLVTDGAAPVSEARIAAAREALGELAVGVSVIALGEENEALRAMVARQRARGERAFYHFVPDDTLRDLARGRIDRGGALHLPEGASMPEAVSAEISALLDDLLELDRKRDVEAVERAEAELRAAADLGIALDGEAARREALQRDVRAIERRFDRWFPAPAAAVTRESDDDDDATLLTIAAIAEIVSVIGGSPLARRAEAIEILEAMLPDAGLTPARWLKTVSAPSPAIVRALAALRAATG
jgi:hypothetical protein